jgi:hypothetical protein
VSSCRLFKIENVIKSIQEGNIVEHQETGAKSLWNPLRKVQWVLDHMITRLRHFECKPVVLIDLFLQR